LLQNEHTCSPSQSISWVAGIIMTGRVSSGSRRASGLFLPTEIRTDVGASLAANLAGEQRLEIGQSSSGHLSAVMVVLPRGPVPRTPNNLFNTTAAGSGTYKVEGNTIIVTYAASWNQTWTGITQKRQFEIVGNKLTVTSEPTKDLAGQDIVFVVTYERVE
jgi:hypothetical protein